MKIDVTNLGKRYNREWIFRNLNFSFNFQQRYAITGPNGSGKSTLLQVLAGAVMHNEGDLKFKFQNKEIDPGEIYKTVSFSAPYLDLVEELTLTEFFNFHDKMKGWISTFDTRQIILLLKLERSAHKQIRYFSSGMKQRVKLAQAIFSDVSAVLLDEPATNLDEEGISLYHFLIENYCERKLVIVSSNDEKEYFFCEKKLNMLEYKSESQ